MTQRTSIARIRSVALTGFSGDLIEVETDIKAGLPSLQIVGMGNKAIDEARQRVRSAITNSSLGFPARKVVVNLAPAELPKDGTHLDIPIALGILVASGQIKPHEVAKAIFAGELALDGQVRPIRGAVVIAEAAVRSGATVLFIPHQNVPQAQLVKGITLIGIHTLQQLFLHLKGLEKLPDTIPPPVSPISTTSTLPTFDDIIGHEYAKRALTIAAAGRHNILFSGPPGTGKTLLARTMAGLLPPLNAEEILEVTKLYSLAYNTDTTITTPPFRAPHHSATLSSLIGGGVRPRPGDLSLAHKGVLFLDELPEYPRATLEALRQPLEDRSIHLSRLYGHSTYPADVQLVATMNPCPCGFYGSSAGICSCSPLQVASYQKRVSGPLLDRIDLRLALSNTNFDQFFNPITLREKQHFKVLKLVLIARKTQKTRYNSSNYYNAYASLSQAKKLFHITPGAWHLIKTAAAQLSLSSRSSLRMLRVARTIADLETSHEVTEAHMAEALQFR